MTCSINGCSSPILARGWCCKHYNRWLAHGDPLPDKKDQTPDGEPMRWLLAHVFHKSDECLPWPFARTPQGYAKIGCGVAIRIMCTQAHGPAPTPKHEAAHSCGKGKEGCINPCHLRWATRAENHADKIAHGTHIQGERHYNAVVTTETVLRIRTLSRTVSAAKIAQQFGVSRGCINQIIYRKTWKHVA